MASRTDDSASLAVAHVSRKDSKYWSIMVWLAHFNANSRIRFSIIESLQVSYVKFNRAQG